MLNTADDLGRPGPDYLFGYGRVNARRAVESLTANTFFEGDLSQGDSTIINIDVPSGAAELRVMLLWNDPAGAPFASPAITNDLDMTLSDPSVGGPLDQSRLRTASLKRRIQERNPPAGFGPPNGAVFGF